MKYKILLLFSFFSIVLLQEEHSFKLEDGTKIVGYIVSEDENLYEVDTDLGLVQIEKKDIKKFQCMFFMNNGDILVGSKISSSENEIILSTDLGVFKIKKEDYVLWVPKLSNDIYIALMFLVAILK